MCVIVSDFQLVLVQPTLVRRFGRYNTNHRVYFTREQQLFFQTPGLMH